jgi:hypothetical protein
MHLWRKVLSHHRPKAMQPTKYRPNSPKPWAKINLFSFKLIISGISYTDGKLTNTIAIVVTSNYQEGYNSYHVLLRQLPVALLDLNKTWDLRTGTLISVVMVIGQLRKKQRPRLTQVIEMGHTSSHQDFLNAWCMLCPMLVHSLPPGVLLSKADGRECPVGQ